MKFRVAEQVQAEMVPEAEIILEVEMVPEMEIRMQVQVEMAPVHMEILRKHLRQETLHR